MCCVDHIEVRKNELISCHSNREMVTKLMGSSFPAVPTVVLWIVLSAVAIPLAAAKEAPDFGSLYKSKSYSQICKSFEADKATNGRNPNSAYFYSLALLGMGKTAAAINVCKSIQRKFPTTEAARQASSAI